MLPAAANDRDPARRTCQAQIASNNSQGRFELLRFSVRLGWWSERELLRGSAGWRLANSWAASVPARRPPGWHYMGVRRSWALSRLLRLSPEARSGHFLPPGGWYSDARPSVDLTGRIQLQHSRCSARKVWALDSFGSIGWRLRPMRRSGNEGYGNLPRLSAVSTMCR